MTLRARIVGLDVARAIALFGMFAAHVADDDAFAPLGAGHGRASALFTVMAGVSISLMWTHAGGREGGAAARAHTRIRVLVRAVLLLVLGWLVQLMETPVDVILDNLGVMFILALAAIGRSPRVLAVASAVFLVGGLWLVETLRAAVDGQDFATWPGVHELWSHHYPAAAWIGYLLAGLAIGAWAPWSGRGRGLLALWGAVAAVLSFGLGESFERSVPGLSPWAPYVSMSPHSYSPIEMIHNVGCAAVTIALSLWLAERVGAVLAPLAAAGSMTLTLYVAHLVVIWVVGDAMVWQPENLAWAVLCLASMGFAWAWQRWLGRRWDGRGPLEFLLTAASNAAARRAVGDVSSRA